MPIKIETKHIKNGDWNISYQLVYPNNNYSKPSIFFIHGLGGSKEVWQKIQEDLANQAGIASCAIDLLGHGSSRGGAVADITLAQMSQGCEVVIATELSKKYTLVAHCLGGIVAQEFLAHTHYLPERILIFSSYSIRPKGFIYTTLSKLTSFFEPKFRNLDYFSTFKRNTRSYSNVGTGDINIRRVYQDILHTSVSTYIHSLNLMIQFDAKMHLYPSRVKEIPTWIVAGFKDIIVPYKSSQLVLSTFCNRKEVGIKSAGHVLPLSHPKKLSKIILSALE